MPFKRLFSVIFFIASSAGTAWASGLNSLELFVKSVKSGKADFTQVVTSPGKDGQPPRSKTSSGQFEFARPNRFKFSYQKPFAQTLVADGQTLWLYDHDLNQITARNQSKVLGATPAALIASAPDLAALQTDFVLTDAPDKDGLQWVLAAPKSKDVQLQSVRVGFRVAPAQPVTLEVLEIQDSFGQRSVLTFSAFEVNPQLPPRTFEFKPPAGADVIKQ